MKTRRDVDGLSSRVIRGVGVWFLTIAVACVGCGCLDGDSPEEVDPALEFYESEVRCRRNPLIHWTVSARTRIRLLDDAREIVEVVLEPVPLPANGDWPEFWLPPYASNDDPEEPEPDWWSEFHYVEQSEFWAGLCTDPDALSAMFVAVLDDGQRLSTQDYNFELSE